MKSRRRTFTREFLGFEWSVNLFVLLLLFIFVIMIDFGGSGGVRGRDRRRRSSGESGCSCSCSCSYNSSGCVYGCRSSGVTRSDSGQGSGFSSNRTIGILDQLTLLKK